MRWTLEASQATFNAHQPRENRQRRTPGAQDSRRLDGPELRLFRLKKFFKPVLIDKKLADEMKGAGFVGSYFKALDRYPS